MDYASFIDGVNTAVGRPAFSADHALGFRRTELDLGEAFNLWQHCCLLCPGGWLPEMIQWNDDLTIADLYHFVCTGLDNGVR